MHGESNPIKQQQNTLYSMKHDTTAVTYLGVSILFRKLTMHKIKNTNKITIKNRIIKIFEKYQRNTIFLNVLINP